ncbi:MAG: hypothetical protein Fur0041_17500 [Bacteroidia bacterium]
MTSVTNCQTTLSVTVSQYPQPVASFNPTFPPCSNVYTFNNTSTISGGNMTYHWDFGDPTLTNDTSNLASPTFAYPNAGTFTVTLIATSNNGCVDTTTMIVNPGNGGQAAFAASTVCLNNATTFTDQSIGATGWSWNFGEPSSGPNNTSTQQNPTHTYSAAGTYTVTLTAQTTPCPSIITQTITVNPLPAASFQYSQVCGGQNVTFTSNSTIQAPDQITGYSWNFGDPGSGPANISTLQNPSHTFSTTGTFTVILTVTSNNNCQSTFSQVINVGPSPVAQFVSDTVCTNSPMTFTNQSQNAATYLWDFGVGTLTSDTSSSANPTYTYTTAGTYTVTLIADPASNCGDTATLMVTVDPGPNVTFAAPAVCETFQSTFTDQSTIASGSITSWSWDFGVTTSTADTSNLQNPTFTYPVSGTYTVTLTCTSNNGCVTTDTMSVIVNPPPVATFTITNACSGFPTAFTDQSTSATGTVNQWSWDFGDGSPINTQQNPTHIYTTNQTYTVTLIVTNSNGCSDTVQLPATSAPLPVVQFEGDTLAGCFPHCVNFTDQTTLATGTVTGWLWDFGDNTPNSTQQNPSHCFSVPGQYTITLTTTTSGGCSSTLTMPNMITVHPAPTASFSATPQVTTVMQTNVVFTDLSQGAPVTWSWDFGDPSTTGDTSSIQNPNYIYSTEYGATYPVHFTVWNQFGCVDDTTLEVIVEPEFAFYIPNAFTPNGDGKNDGFFGTGIGIASYQIWIFDRWGNMIFTTKDINEAWNGTVQGKSGEICQEDVYVWKVMITDVFNKKHKYIGHVSLIK